MLTRPCLRRGAAGLALAGLVVLGCPPAQAELTERQRRAVEQIEERTGYRLVEPEGADDPYMVRDIRGYRVVLMGAAGDVWGRWAARVAAGEVGRELGGMWAYLTGSTEYGPGVTGSVFDDLLSSILGQPITLVMFLHHPHAETPRLDVVSGSFPHQVDDLAPRVARVSLRTGHIHSSDEALARAILDDRGLRDRLRRLEGQYLRIDEETVSFYWAGDESAYSQLIRRHGDYFQMVNGLTKLLADLADRIAGDGDGG